MLIIDFNYLVIAATANATSEFQGNINEKIVRSMVLTDILNIRNKFRSYGEVVIALDSNHNWRYQYFPYYKAKRQTADLKFDIKFAKECAKAIGQDLKDYFPYKVIRVDGAEADDIVATLTKYARGADGDLVYRREVSDVMIVSPDKDFKPLQSIKGVKQWSPRLRAEIREPDPIGFLAQLIIKGDTSDGVPNIYSDDDHFVKGGRQKAVTSKVLGELTELFKKKEPFPDELQQNFKRNKTLVDLLECVPDNISQAVMEQYHKYQPVPKMKLLSYCSKHQLVNLASQIQHF